MIAVPLLAWSRFQIPSGSIPAAQMDAVRVHLQAHVLAADAKTRSLATSSTAPTSCRRTMSKPRNLPKGWPRQRSMAAT
jgi:hypothetical protein